MLFKAKMAVTSFAYSVYGRVVYWLGRLLGLIEFFLFLRLVLKFFAASPKSFVVSKIFWLTDVLVWPFNFAFPNFYLEKHLIETASLLAMLGYALALFVVLAVLKLIFRDR